MRTFYFVGGPTAGHAKEFFRRLGKLGGPPPGWQLYAHASQDGKALHIVRAANEEAITAHLAHFSDIYEATPPTEVIEGGAGTEAQPERRTTTRPINR